MDVTASRSTDSYEDSNRERVDGEREISIDASMTTTAALDASYDRLTRDNAVLLLIDHQIGPLWELEFTASRRRVVELATVARRLDIPTVVSAIAPESWGPIIPELRAVLPNCSITVRRMVNAWLEPSVRGAVEATGRKKLVIAGSVVEVAVAMCALAASGAGYEVYTPIDASGQSSHPAVARMSRAGIIITTTSLVLDEILADRAGAKGRAARRESANVEQLSAGELLKRRLRTSRQAAADAQRRRREEL
jgi:hypothetical protein